MQSGLLKNFNLFVAGRGFAGQIEQLTLPKLSLKTEDFQLGGLDTPVKMDMGLEPMTCELTLTNYDAAIISGFGHNVSRSTSEKLTSFVLKGAYQPFDLTGFKRYAIEAITVNLTGTWQSLDFGQWQSGQQAKLTAVINVRYYQLKLGKKTAIEIDVDNKVRKVNKQDQLKSLRPWL